MTRVQFSKAWCNECFANCYFSYNEQTSETKHIGAGTVNLAQELEPLKKSGYYIKHSGHGDYTATLYKAAPIALPLDWQIALIETHEPAIDQNQDW